MIQIDKNLTELAHIAAKESVPVPDVSDSVMNTLMSVNTVNGGYSLRLWFMTASIAASFVMVFMAYRVNSANTFSEMLEMVAWAV